MDIERLNRIIDSKEKIKLLGTGVKTILTFVPKLTGVHYYRLLLPLRYMQVVPKITNRITETQLASCDILFYNRVCNLMPGQVELLKKKYRFKVVIDIDDYWKLPVSNPLHPIFNNDITVNQTKTNIEAADVVIVSSKFLYDECKKLNKNVVLIPNALSFADSPTEKINTKFGITWLGSATHQGDLEILTNPMKRVSEDKELLKQFNLYLSGFNIHIEEDYKDVNGKYQVKPIRNRVWASYERILTNEYKLVQDKEHKEKLMSYTDYESDLSHNYERLSPLQVDEYLNLYRYSNLSLVPLENNDFNKSKSLLKLLEGAATNTVSIVSNVEPYNQFSDCYFQVNKQSDWYSTIKKVVENPDVIKEKLVTLKETFKQFDISEVNKLRETIFDSKRSDIQLNDKTTIYSICYNQNQTAQFTRYDNPVKTVEEKSYLFEYNPVIKLVDKVNTEYVGIFSHKFAGKTGYSTTLINRLMSDYDKDVYIFCPYLCNAVDYIDKTERYHPGFTKIFMLLCDRIGLNFTKNLRYLIYSNFFIAKTEFYNKFVEDIIKPAINVLENELKTLAWKDAQYPGLNKEDLNKYTGLDYYPMHTFLLERLLSVYLTNNNFKVLSYDK